MDAWMFVASEDATEGSVIAKQERISPSRRGCSQRPFCSSEPYLSSTCRVARRRSTNPLLAFAIGERSKIEGRRRRRRRRRRFTSMLPVSGAEQLKASDANGILPITSASLAYSSLLSPCSSRLHHHQRMNINIQPQMHARTNH